MIIDDESGKTGKEQVILLPQIYIYDFKKYRHFELVYDI
jgi:hypothetical protein